MLFRKKIQSSCQHCIFGTKLNQKQMLCTKRGIVDQADSCRKFSYDPFKRVPVKPKAPDFSQYEEDDFSL